MAFLKKVRANAMGITPRQMQILEAVKAATDRNDLLKGNPDAPSIALTYLNWFAEEHGRPDISALSDREVSDFIALLDGIHFPTHPDDMARAGKFGCDKCRVFYADMWDAATAPRLNEIERQIQTGERPPMSSDEAIREAVVRLEQQEKFLSE